jgi:hypothetical protein
VQNAAIHGDDYAKTVSIAHHRVINRAYAPSREVEDGLLVGDDGGEGSDKMSDR